MAQLCGGIHLTPKPTMESRFRPSICPAKSLFFCRVPLKRAATEVGATMQCSSYTNFRVRCNSSGAGNSYRRTRPDYVPNRIDDPCYVRIFDTTLRDGEQSPGATMTSKEKLDIARHLSRLGVDIIEAGFPIASPDDLQAVKMIAKEVGNHVDDDGYVPVICGLSRCNKVDIDAAWEAVRWALKPRIHTFIATSDIHLNHKLKKSREEVINIARDMVAYARSLGCNDVEFSPEDAGRSPSFLRPSFFGESKQSAQCLLFGALKICAVQ